MPVSSVRILFLVSLLSSNAAFAEGKPFRLIPPESMECAADHLTNYTGKVVMYRRTTGYTDLRIATDWGTLETVRLQHAGPQDPAARYLIEGKAFESSDWRRVEVSDGRLRKGIRAAAWVCDDGSPTLIDWLPPKE